MGRVVLLTGCSTGIGLALTREFASRGDKVFATARRESSVKDLQGKFEGNPNVEVVQLDVESQPSVDAAIKEIKSKTGKIDILVNNAGATLRAPLMELPLHKMEEMNSVNCVGLLRVTQAVAPIMIEQGSGQIVNIGSLLSVLTIPFNAAYSCSKHAVAALTDSLRMELKPFGIDCTLICPGYIKSDFVKNDPMTEEIVRNSRWYSPIFDLISKRIGNADDRTPTDVFAKQVADAVEKRPRRWFGGKNWRMVKYVTMVAPMWVIDRILAGKSGLPALEQKVKEGACHPKK